MALLPLAAGGQVSDASGVPVSGGQVRVYIANTTTLASLYSDAAMTVPLSNPVVCNSAGYPSSNGTDETLIFLADGDYDVAYLDADDAELVSFTDVPTVGEEGADITRTLADNTRFKVTGSGGYVLVQAGDASPDSVGGKMKLQGQAGTQLDELLLDAAAIDTTGTFTENGKKLQGVVYTAGTSFSGASSVSITLPEEPAGCRMFLVEVIDLKLSTDTAGLWARLAYEGGAVKTGATDYAYIGTATAAQILLATDPELDTMPGFLRLTIVTPDSGTAPTIIDSRLAGYDSTQTDPEVFHQVGYGLGSYGRATTLQLLASAGNISGVYRVIPQRGFGET